MFDDVYRAERLNRTVKDACLLKHFTLYAFCILPDHVHMLAKKDSLRAQLSISRGLENPRSKTDNSEHFTKAESRLSSLRTLKKEHTLSDLMQSIKGNFSYTLPGYGRFWQPRSYCRVVTSERYLRSVLDYIQNNHQKHDLPKNPYGFPPYVFIDEMAINGVFGLDA